MKKVKIVVICILAIVFLSPVALLHGQAENTSLGSQRVGTRGAQFLKLGVGARSLALGNSFTSVVDDASSVFTNPAGLALVEGTGLFANYISFIAEINVYSFSVSMPVKGSVIGISLLTLSTGDIEETSEFNPEGTGRTFSASDIAIGVTWASQVFDRLALGGTVKYIEEGLAERKSRTVSFDFGTHYESGYRGIVLGMAIQHLGPDMRLGGTFLGFNDLRQEAEVEFESFPLPLVFKVGVSGYLMQRGLHSVLLSTELNNPIDTGLRGNLGGEYSFDNKIFLRTGYRFSHDELGLSFGGGVRIPIESFNRIQIDYAFLDFGRFNSVQNISLAFSF